MSAGWGGGEVQGASSAGTVVRPEVCGVPSPGATTSDTHSRSPPVSEAPGGGRAARRPAADRPPAEPERGGRAVWRRHLVVAWESAARPTGPGVFTAQHHPSVMEGEVAPSATPPRELRVESRVHLAAPAGPACPSFDSARAHSPSGFPGVGPPRTTPFILYLPTFPLAVILT